MTTKIQYMNSTFAERPLPTAIWVNEECIAGPFCTHCGWPFTLHGPDMRCRRDCFPFLPPSCDCHRIESDEEMDVRANAHARARSRPRR